MLDPEKVGGFKIHVARDSRKLFDAVDGQKAKEGEGGSWILVELSSLLLWIRSNRGINVAENEKIRKEKKNDVQSF